MPMLYNRREKIRRLEEAEADGESFWSLEISVPCRLRLLHAMKLFSADFTNDSGDARRLIVIEDGLDRLAGEYLAHEDVDRFIRVGTTGDVATLIEAMDWALQHSRNFQSRERVLGYRDMVNVILREDRVSFEFVEGQIIPMSSQELHTVVVEPTLRLLSHRAGWDEVESAYQEALEELSGGKPDDAITDAARALEATLQKLGCGGNTLGALRTSAISKGLLAAYDGKIIDWVSADRGNIGDAHTGPSVSTDDAWLIVHVVGALILRLAGGGSRATG